MSERVPLKHRRSYFSGDYVAFGPVCVFTFPFPLGCSNSSVLGYHHHHHRATKKSCELQSVRVVGRRPGATCLALFPVDALQGLKHTQFSFLFVCLCVCKDREEEL